MSEREIPQSKPLEHNNEGREYSEALNEHYDDLKEQKENKDEKENDRISTEEALEQASEIARDSDEKKKVEQDTKPRHKGAPSKKELGNTYKEQLTLMQSDMGVARRTWSKLIHISVIEKASDLIGSTIAKPNALLAGSVFALVSVTILYFLAKHYGFQLSGLETITAFAIGWLLGTLYDYISGLFRRKH